MKILIIGGSGFVSGTLAAAALAVGHEVWAVTRGTRAMLEGVQAIVADRKDHAGFQKAVVAAGQRWDLVVDCIGYEVADARQDIEMFRQRTGRLVFISTDFVFDPAQRTFPQTEEGACRTGEDYGGKKRLCELELANSAGLSWTVVRPCHIYGPGSQLGCLPTHGRDPQLIAKMRRGEPLKLVGGGHFLQQPVFAADLAQFILACAVNKRTVGQIYQIAGPDVIESRRYYEIIAEALGVKIRIEELPVGLTLQEHPEMRPFLCHRIYDLNKARQHVLPLPATPIEAGLRTHLEWLLTQGN